MIIHPDKVLFNCCAVSDIFDFAYFVKWCRRTDTIFCTRLE